jgi:hypothetical protein
MAEPDPLPPRVRCKPSVGKSRFQSQASPNCCKILDARVAGRRASWRARSITGTVTLYRTDGGEEQNSQEKRQP